MGHRIFLLMIYALAIGAMEVSLHWPISCARQTDFKEQFMEMDDHLPEKVEIKKNLETGTIVFLKGENLSKDLEQDPKYQRLVSDNQYDEIAYAFITAYRSDFKIENPYEELKVDVVKTDDIHKTHVKFDQFFADIPVWASEIIVHLDENNHVYLVNGRYVPTPGNVEKTPALTEQEALAVVNDDLNQSNAKNTGGTIGLVFYPVSARTLRLAYHIRTTSGLTEQWDYFIDAANGNILDKISVIRTIGSRGFRPHMKNIV